MEFYQHKNLVGSHSFLSASKYHWVNYDTDKLISTYNNFRDAQRGTELHEFAATCIKLGQKLPKTNQTLNMYVNDAIGFKMKPEQVLYYSMNCFGTADAISFKNNLLRIHDLKTGESPASVKQLEIYMAMFCLEYKQQPDKIDAELRIYQMNEKHIHIPESDKIFEIMEKIITFDKIISEIDSEVA